MPNLSQLRQQAEQILSEEATTLQKITKDYEALQAIVHELRVHQIELELQNQELQQTQAELEKAKESYAELYDFAPSCYLTLDATGTVLQINLTGSELLGIERFYINDRPFQIFLPPDSQMIFLEHLQQVSDFKQTQHCELTIRKTDGSLFDAHLESLPVFDDNDNFWCCRSVLIDISEKKQAQREILKSHQRYENLFQTSEVALWDEDFSQIFAELQRLKRNGVTDLRSYLRSNLEENVWRFIRMIKINEVNTATLRLFGATQLSDLLYSYIRIFSPPQALDCWTERLCAIWEGKTSFQKESVLCSLDNRNLAVLISMPIPTQEEDFHSIPISVIDITEHKQTELLQRLQRDFSFQLSQASTLTEVWRHLFKMIFQLESIDCGGLYLMEKETDHLTLVYHQGLSDRFVQNVCFYGSDSPQKQLIMQKRPTYLHYQKLYAPGTSVRLNDWCLQEGLRAVVVLPILHHGHIIGVVNFASHTHNEIPFLIRSTLEMLANQTAIFLTRLQMEETLRNNEARLQAILDNAAVGITLVDSKTAQFLQVNNQWVNMIGYSAVELSQMDIAAVSESREELQTNLKLRQQLLAGQIDSIQMEKRYRRKDGSVFWGDLTVTPLRDAHGWLGMDVGIIVDITERKQAEEALRRSEASLKAIFDNAAVGIIQVGPDGRFIQVNTQWTRMTGYSEEEILQMTFQAFTHPEDVPLSRELMTKLATGLIKSFHLEKRYVCKTGNVFWGEVSVTPIYSDGTYQASVGVIIDITERKHIEAALRHSEERFNLAMQGTSDGLWDLNYETEEVYYSPRFKQMLGLAAHDTLSVDEVIQRIHPQDIEPVWRMTQDYLTRQIPTFQCTLRIRHQDGHYIWILSRGIAFWNDQGTVTRFVGTHLDLTTQKQAEAKLARFNQLTEQLLKMPLIIYRLNEAGIFTEVKGAGLKQLGLQNDEMVGRDIVYFFPNAKEYVELALSGTTQHFLYEFDYQGIHLAYENLLSLADGEVSGIALDVSEQVAAEHSLRESEQYWRTLIQEAQIGLGLLNTEGMFVDTNPALANLLGYEVTEFLDQKLSTQDLTPAKYAQSDIEQECLLVATGRFGPYEKEYLHKEGYNVPVHLSGIVVERHGEIFYWINVADITDQKVAEESLHRAKEVAETANRAKSVFLANMSHELRTPLNAVLGFAQILKRDQTLNEQQQEDVTIIERNGEHLLTLINDVLDLAKIEANRIEIVPTQVHLDGFLRGICDLLRMKTDQKGLSLRYQPLTGLPEIVQVDETRLRQILVNLLGNAIKFTKKGWVNLKVGYHFDKLRFQVEDSGIGIATEDLPKLFSPFQQVGERDYQSQGTGLGLAISKKLANMMGGVLYADSQLGQGSTFWLELQLPEIKGVSEPQLPEKSLPLVGFQGPPRKILVVEDNPENRALLVNLLTPLGFCVEEAVNGLEGLEKAQQFKPDVILMDLIMPVLDGWDATQRIRGISDLKETIIIAISASAFEVHQQKSLNVGCNDFIAKPIHVDVLLEKLRNLLQLTWIYDPSLPPSATFLVESEEVDWSLNLTKKQAETLYGLAMMGDISGLRHYADSLEHSDEKLISLAKQLRKWTKDFQYEAIVEVAQRKMG